MFPKIKRIQDEKLLELLRTQPCVACGKPPPSEVDHILHKGSGHGDTIDNCWPLCREHHSMKHQIGIRRFAMRFERCHLWLKDHKGYEDLLKEIENLESLN